MVSLRSGILFAVIAAVVWKVYFSNAPVASSVVTLALHYLSRPHVPLKKNQKFSVINRDVAWNGSYMSKHPEIWSDILTLSEKKSIHASVLQFEKLNKSMEMMKKEDFIFSSDILKKFDYWRHQLGPDGRGFQLIRGVPVDWWNIQQAEIFYWAFGKYLGIPGAQDSAGNLLGHVTDVGPTNQTERPYRQKVDIAYHCDGSDVVGLLCINGAKSGGESRIISSVTVFNKLLTQYPRGQEYAARLFGKIMLFTRKTFGIAAYLPVNPLRLDADGVLRTYWNQEYYLKAYKNLNNTLTPFGESDPFALEAVAAYDEILNKDLRKELPPDEELGMSMNLQQGDIQLISNHFILHARTEFEDYTDAEIATSRVTLSEGSIGPIGRRDLLRLWLSELNENMKWSAYISKQIDFIRVLGGLAEGIIFYR